MHWHRFDREEILRGFEKIDDYYEGVVMGVPVTLLEVQQRFDAIIKGQTWSDIRTVADLHAAVYIIRHGHARSCAWIAAIQDQEFERTEMTDGFVKVSDTEYTGEVMGASVTLRQMKRWFDVYVDNYCIGRASTVEEMHIIIYDHLY